MGVPMKEISLYKVVEAGTKRRLVKIESACFECRHLHEFCMRLSVIEEGHSLCEWDSIY